MRPYNTTTRGTFCDGNLKKFLFDGEKSGARESRGAKKSAFLTRSFYRRYLEILLVVDGVHILDKVDDFV